jgi:HKD family nuclease
VVNGVLNHLAALTEELVIPPTQLLHVLPLANPGQPAVSVDRPSTPLADAALLTNAKDEPSLGAELRAEFGSADQVDLLCAFVKWHGLRLLQEPMRARQERGVPLRIITTTYMGATERAALDRLVREFGADVRIQYDAQRTRLHAKAWMFRRATRFDTAYVGSSNLSRAALLDGVEWNVRLSRVATPALLEKFTATFDTYWNEASFEQYDPDRDRDRLDDALAEASGRIQHNRVTISLWGLEVRPYPYQQQMLDALDAERTVHDRHRNLLVAATGTGKTVVAALDYRRLCDPVTGQQPSLLFVAHRREILHQSQRTYQEVLGDADFGELYVDGARPERWRHVFASVQSLTSYGVDNLPCHAFDIVVIDEFHHTQAATYRRLLARLAPEELLGFCVSVAHAEYMAQVFNDAGVPARAVSGKTSLGERERALVELRSADLNILFAADQSDALPLGVTVDDDRRIPHRPALPHRRQHCPPVRARDPYDAHIGGFARLAIEVRTCS